MSYPKTISIGRSSANDICLGDSDSSVSRRHAEIVIAKSGELLLTDCASTCGTHLRSGSGWKAVRQHAVVREDEVCFGEGDTVWRIGDLIRQAKV